MKDYYDIQLKSQIVTGSYVTANKTVQSVYTASSLTKTSGGAYKCTFTFNSGDPIEKETDLRVYCKLIKITSMPIALKKEKYCLTFKTLRFEGFAG